jgi:hypothetical protein
MLTCSSVQGGGSECADCVEEHDDSVQQWCHPLNISEVIGDWCDEVDPVQMQQILDKEQTSLENGESIDWSFRDGKMKLTETHIGENFGIQQVQNPGARFAAVTWQTTPGSKVYFFGGVNKEEDGSETLFNDMWRYDIVTDTYTLLGGHQVASDQVGVYPSTVGKGDESSWPGARSYASSWFDSERQRLYMFGGKGFGTGTINGRLNDLWYYDLAMEIWMWESGSTSVDPYGKYGALAVADSNSIPGGRYGCSTWTDPNGRKLYLFGGLGFNDAGVLGLMSDLWYYDLRERAWAWEAGSIDTEVRPVPSNPLPNNFGTPIV